MTGEGPVAVAKFDKIHAMSLWLGGNCVVSIAPTFIDTPLTAPFFANHEFRQWVEDRIPLGRVGTVEEVAAMILAE